MLLFVSLNNVEGGGEEEAPTLIGSRMLRGMGVVLPVLSFLSARGR